MSCWWGSDTGSGIVRQAGGRRGEERRGGEGRKRREEKRRGKERCSAGLEAWELGPVNRLHILSLPRATLTHKHPQTHVHHVCFMSQLK